MKIAVIGAGPAGMTAGYELSKAIPTGKISRLDIYEASSHVGGLARSLRLWQQTVDLGPHRFFSNDRIINQLWLEVVQNDYELVNRLTRIFYRNKFYYYPLRAGNALSNLGLLEAARCVSSYLREKVSPSRVENDFESWVTSRFGKRLFEIFFKTYSEKLWGISCKELDADFAAQRIKKLSLYEAVKSAFTGNKGNKHKTLVDQFAYPLSGTGSVYEKMAALSVQNGANVFTNTPVESLVVENGKITGIKTEAGEIQPYDHVISTMPLSLLVSRIPGVPEDIRQTSLGLRFRNTILVYLLVDSPSLFPDQWLYVHSGDITAGRITNFRNWVPGLYGQDEKNSILCMELWCNFDDATWQMEDDEISANAISDIHKTGLIGNANVLDTYVYRIPRCYPVYFTGYQQYIDKIRSYLSGFTNLQVIGRYGAYKYNNQDHSILMGLYAAGNLVENASHDLWAINTDYETYQEQSTITKSGLQINS